MKPYTLHLGNCHDVLDTLEENSVDSIVTDPPYEINFMAKSWDNAGVAFNPVTWEKALRVLKPGGHMLVFGHSRKMHRIIVAIEDAGFEIRDTLMWLYGSGFPKSHNIGKAIDKMLGVEHPKNTPISDNTSMSGANYTRNKMKVQSEAAKKYEGWGTALKPAREDIVLAQKPFEPCIVTWYDEVKEAIKWLLKLYAQIVVKSTTSNHHEQNEVVNTVLKSVEKNTNTRDALKEVTGILPLEQTEDTNLNTVLSCLNILGEILETKNTYITSMDGLTIIELKTLRSWALENTSQNTTPQNEMNQHGTLHNVSTAESILNVARMRLNYIQEAFVQESVISKGKGKDLHPKIQPIVLACKPFKGSVAENALEHGTGGINVDECRVGDELIPEHTSGKTSLMGGIRNDVTNGGYVSTEKTGRFPANVIHDGSEESTKDMWDWETDSDASRYFYCAKASKKDRDEGLFKDFETVNDGRKTDIDNAYQRGLTPRKNTHPTVKPTELMQYLVRLITPKGGIVLDPFMGSGSTGKAAMIENQERNANYKFIGIDLTKEYIDIAKARIEYGLNYFQNKEKEVQKVSDQQTSIFDLESE